MKKLIAAAGLGAALTTAALLGAEQANADTDTFLVMMHRMGYSSRMSDAELLKNGDAACDLFNQGYSYGAVSNEVHEHVTNLSYDDTYYFVGVAKAGLC